MIRRCLHIPRRVAAAAAAVSLCAGAPFALAQPTPPAPAQPAPPSDPYEGRPIRELRLLRRLPDDPSKTEPVTDGLAQLIRNQIRSSPGLPFSRDVAKEDITRLNRLGRFRTIDSDAQLMSDGSVTLTYIVFEQPLVQDVQVVGNRELSDQDILKEVAVLAHTPIDRFQIDRSARAIEELYRSKGFYQARVDVDEKVLAESSIVVFRVIEGPPVRVTRVAFEGNQSFTPRELRSQIKTTTFVPIFEKAPLDDDVLTADRAALVQFYRDRGYLDAQAGFRVQPSPDGREAVVTFLINEGPLYSLRSIRVLYVTPEAVEQYRREILKDERADTAYLTPEQMRRIGRRPFSDAQVAGLLVIKPGDVYSEDKIRKSLDALRAAYGKLGYIFGAGHSETGRPQTVAVNPRPIRDEHAPEVDVLLFISEGKPYLTGAVNVIGNDVTKQQVILREIQVRPDRPLDADALEDSRRRLEDLRLFEPGSVRITLEPEDRLNPGRRDVNVEVRETNTGALNLGAAIGSDNGIVGRIAVVQRNFDIADVPTTWSQLFTGHAFRGAGQTSDLEIQPGTQFSIYSYTLTEPHLFETNYSGSGRVFFQTREFDEYDEKRYGFHLGVGRKFGSVWEGVLSSRIESIDLTNIDPGAPVDTFAVENPHTLTSLGLTFVRNTTDSRTRPTRGGRLELGIEQVGVLGGDFDFTHLKSSYTAFFPVYESFLGYKTILKLQARAEYIPQGQEDAPIYERLYMGGQSFRGFRYRAISPVGIRNDTHTLGDDPIGGTFLFFAGAEVNQPLYKDILSVVGFVDTGTVDTTASFSDYRISAGFGFRLYIRQLSPVPIAFDFGFPILSQDTDRERVFTFSIDLPYQ